MDTLALIYFATHIPVTLLLDAQAVLPARFTLPAARSLLSTYAKATGDPFMSRSSFTAQHMSWFRSLVWCELLFQLPVFFALTYGYARGVTAVKRWVHVLTLVYGVHVVTTVWPVLWVLAVDPGVHLELVPVYAPYLLVPLVLAVRSARVLFGENTSRRMKRE